MVNINHMRVIGDGETNAFAAEYESPVRYCQSQPQVNFKSIEAEWSYFHFDLATRRFKLNTKSTYFKEARQILKTNIKVSNFII